MKPAEMRELDTAALDEKLAEFREELFSLRFQHATAQLENTQRIKAVKKNVARILTIMNEREAGSNG
jgi:large subunit ribosomal protein L29